MNRFNGLSTICAIIGILGWMAAGIGIMAAVILLPKSGMAAFYIGCTSVGTGLSAIIIAGAVEVLICIYCNTLPAEAVAEHELQ
jgi:hypothetical protein